MKPGHRGILLINLFAVLLIFVAYLFLSGPIVSANFPLKFSSIRHDIGVIGWEQKSNISYDFENVSTSPISYLVIHKNCCGIKDTEERRTVLPGNKNSINVSFDPSGFSGTQIRTTNVTVEGYRSSIPLNLTAFVQQPLIVSPAKLEFGNLKSGDNVAKSISFHNTCSRRTHLRLASTSGSAQLSTIKLELQPDEIKNVSIDLRQVGFGSVQDTIEVQSDSEPHHILRIPVHAQVRSKWHLSKEQFFFGFMKIGDSLSQSLTVEGLKSANIKRAWTDFIGGKVQIFSDRSNTGTIILLSATIQKAESERIKKSVFIETEDSIEPLLVLKIESVGFDPSVSECCSNKHRK